MPGAKKKNHGFWISMSLNKKNKKNHRCWISMEPKKKKKKIIGAKYLTSEWHLSKNKKTCE